MNEVVLDEHDLADAESGPARPLAHRSRRPRRVAVVGAGLGVVALALAGAQLVLDLRHRASDEVLAARFADAHGVAMPFDDGLTAAWTADPTEAEVLRTGATVGDVVVGVQRRGADVQVVALDADDGTRRWSTAVDVALPDLDERPYWLTDDVGGAQDAEQALAAAAARIGSTWCMAAHGSPPAVVCGAARGDYASSPLATTTWLLDPVDGVLYRTMSSGAGTSVTPVGDDLVYLSGVAADGGVARTTPPLRWHVTAADPRSGEVRWEWTSPDLVEADAGGVPMAWLDGQGDRVAVHSLRTTWVVARAGVALDAPEVRAESVGVTASTGEVVATGVRMVVGDDGLLVQEEVPALVADDGSLPDVVLGARVGGFGAGVVGRAADDSVLWVADGKRPLAVLDGQVLVATILGLALLDGQDGGLVWSTDLGEGDAQVATDGRTVLVRGEDTVRAVSLATGEVVWEKSFDDLGAPADVYAMTVLDGLRRVVMAGRYESVVLR